MLGFYIVGFNNSLATIIFSLIVSIGVAIGYCLIGANWLIMKTEDDLQIKSVRWAKISLIGAVFCIGLVSLATPIASSRIFEKWFVLPNFYYLFPIPLITLGLIVMMYFYLKKLPMINDKNCWVPFFLTILVSILCFLGLSYSFFPYIVPNQMLITEAASATSSLWIILFGAVIFNNIDLGVGTDWQKEIFRIDAPLVSHSISASGGSEKTSYYVSAGFTGQEGLIYGKDKQFFNRSTFRANFNTDLSSKLKLIVNNRFSNLKDSGLGDIIFNALNMSPTTPVFADDGSYAISNTITQEIKNPMAQISNSYGEGNTNTISGKIELQYDLLKDLKVNNFENIEQAVRFELKD